jgi:hypothetical protein
MAEKRPKWLEDSKARQPSASFFTFTAKGTHLSHHGDETISA